MKIEPQRYRIALTLHSIFFPFTQPEFLTLLKQRGYTLGQPVPPVFFAGQRAYISGRIATKDNCALDVNQEGKTVAIEGNSKDNVAKLMEELTAMARKDFHVNFKTDLNFIELTTNVVVTSEGNPLNKMSNYFREKCDLEGFDKIMGTPTSLYEIAIVPNDVPPNSFKWFDFRIAPRVTAFTRQYYVHAIFRDRNVTKVLKFTRKVDSRILDIVKEIEGR